MKKIIVLLVAMCLAFLMLAGCSSSSSGDKKSSESKLVDLKMGTEAWIGYGPWWIADQAGIFKKNGINSDIIMFKQDADINAAFASDKIQFANIASHTAMKMKANNNLDLKGVAFLDESKTADAMITMSKYKDLAALKGKKIAYEEGTTSDLLFRQAVKSAGLSMKDFNVVYMAASDAGLALLSNKVDAAVTYEPYISTIMQKNKKVHRIYSGEDSPGLISDMTVAKSSYLSKNPGIKAKLQKVWDEALDYWKEHPDEGNKMVAEASGTSVDELPTIVEGIKFFTLDQQKDDASSGKLSKGLANIKGILNGQKQLKKDLDVDELIDIN
ncbi:ABC transporter substrate-binding protein [Sporolactobacillus terrae]|nr:ABC transporter substrate-binding protein [Sporolactobacillus terrae]UAK16129.1 ABC transporter substrate-binding protein [Sporolactobacillus terrae]BBN97553.1 hypothetical protein St703_02580 [Sporolactobacillus terrae]